jgi:hypothetical protein
MDLLRGILPWILAPALMASSAACREPGAATAPGPLASSAPSPAGAGAGDELERARACGADTECEHLGDFCNGGCAVTVNRRHRDAVIARLSTPHRTCAMDCPPVDPPVCRKGRCESPSR